MSTAQKKRITVELVFASEDQQQLQSLTVETGLTARELVAESTLPADFPEFDFLSAPLGVWGKLVAGSKLLKNGDRVEVYRPLRHDPREARRELATHGQSMGQVVRSEDD